MVFKMEIREHIKLHFFGCTQVLMFLEEYVELGNMNVIHHLNIINKDEWTLIDYM